MDNKDKLPPIPTPVSQRWREFRIQVLPFVFFLAVVIAIVVLWRSYVQPIGVIGFAETNQVNVTSLSDGVVEQLYVESFQVVTQGQPIALIVGTSPDLLKAQVAAAETTLQVTGDRLKMDQVRVEQNIIDAQQQLLDYSLQQATARDSWFLRSNEWFRSQAEFAKKVISASEFEKVKSAFDTTVTQITERDKAIANLSESVTKLRSQTQNAPHSIEQAMDAERTKLELELKPTELRAPMDGMVTLIHRRKGERILRGDSIATVADTQARRVIGYVRQPVSLLPTTNDTVRIVKRTAPQMVGNGKIERIGAQFEFINPALLSADTKRMEVGLPILVSVPNGFPLVPGEYVTLTIDYAH